MTTPPEPAIRSRLAFEPHFNDVDTALEQVPDGMFAWRELNAVAASIQGSVRASETIERYVLQLWEATERPAQYGIALDDVDMNRLVLAGASPRGMSTLVREARVVAWLAGRVSRTSKIQVHLLFKRSFFQHDDVTVNSRSSVLPITCTGAPLPTLSAYVGTRRLTTGKEEPAPLYRAAVRDSTLSSTGVLVPRGGELCTRLFS
jgi:hypothetical protein